MSGLTPMADPQALVPVTLGGTGLTSYAIGDILYASATTTLAKLADVAVGNALISGGVGVAPAWGKIALPTHVSGVLPQANGGTGVANAGTLTNASNTTVTGGGTVALGGFTLTVPATGTAVLLSEAQTVSGAKTFSAVTTVSNTTTPSTATNGAHVVGNGTEATSVTAGGGLLWSGGSLHVGTSANVPTLGKLRVGDANSDFYVAFRFTNAENGISWYSNFGGSVSGSVPAWQNNVVLESAKTAGACSTIYSAFSGSHIFQTGAGRTARLTIADAAITFSDSYNIILNATTGTKVGTATSQKLGFWNATPVIQYATTGTLLGFTAGAGTAARDDSTFTGNTGAMAYTVGDLVRALKLAGIMAA